ncbi:disulfide bond formation protein B [Ferrovibrio sp.]|uniref:disulfide bond formation protein B n=1 Tax=Ferrovibrio sp. TaxID=1917215 RepID=UPI003D2C35EA
MFDRLSAQLAGLLFAGLSALTLGAAFVAQYGFGLAPCQLCLWQRWPYAAAILLGLAAWRLERFRPLLLWLVALSLAITAGVGLFHTGVEQKWWAGLESCGGGNTATTLEALRAQVLSAPIVRCDEAAFSFLGLSMAAWNALWGALLAILAAIKARQA